MYEIPGHASTAVTEESGVGGVDEIMACVADLGTGAAAALAVNQPTRVAEVPAPGTVYVVGSISDCTKASQTQ